jgi:steroid 5-alpha reductase family enzyme
MNFIAVSAASLAIVVVVHTTTFLIGRRIGRYNIVDVAWGVGFVAVAAVAAVVGTGDLFRRILLLVLAPPPCPQLTPKTRLPVRSTWVAVR